MLEKRYECKTCGEKYVSESRLQNHFDSCHAGKTFDCPEPDCNVKLRAKTSVKKHVERKHKKSEKHKCSECDYITVYKEALKGHFNIQHSTTATEYCCSVCNYKSKSKGNFRRHEQTHIKSE